MSRLLTETTLTHLEPLAESSGDPAAPKKLRVRGLFQREGVKNGNGRVYPKGLLKREVDRLKEAVDKRGVLMSVDHPQPGQPASLLTAGAVLTSLAMDGGDVVGEAEILNTDAGRQLAEIVRAKCRVGISSRGMGSTKTESRDDGPADIVQEDFQLISFDFVGEPSLASAGITSHFEEAKGGPPMSFKDLKEMKEKAPELFKALHDEDLKEINAEVETKLVSRVEEATKKLSAKIREEERAKILKEGEDQTVGRVGTGYYNRLAAVIANLAKLGIKVPELDSLSNDMQSAASKIANPQSAPRDPSAPATPNPVGDPSAALAGLEGLKASHQKLTETVVRLDQALKRKEIEAAIAVESVKFPEIVRADVAARLATCESVEEVTAAALEERQYLEKLAKASPNPTGRGRSFAGAQDGAGTATLTEQQKRMRAALGLPNKAN